MELQPVNGHQEMTDKQNLVNFVHDILDMEIRAFTLRRVASSIKEEKSGIERQIDDIHKSINKEKDKIKNDVLKQEDNVRSAENLCKRPFLKDLFEDLFSILILLRIFVAGFISALLVLGIGYFPMLFNMPPLKFVQIYEESNLKLFSLPIYISTVLCIVLVWTLISTLMYRKGNIDHLKRANIYLAKLKASYEQIDEVFHEERKKIAKLQLSVEALNQRIYELETAAEIISQKIEMCYNLNIIKPAYRNLVCVTILDEIFINDKADTMREAMILCDNEIRHKELMGKLDQVVYALKQIGSTLSHMNYVLNSINENVSMISQDIYNMKESQEKIAYAAESVQKSAENADMYIYQRRTGMI